VGTSSTLQFPQKRRSGRGISTKNKIIKKKRKINLTGCSCRERER
jgi:hypothetical protein